MQVTVSTDEPPPGGARPYQWVLVGLLSLNFGIAFFDRNALSFLMPFIQPELGLSNTKVGALASALSFSWALAGHPNVIVCTVISVLLVGLQTSPTG
jgi:sugar phosphate permease